MASAESMFLFEIAVDDLKCFSQAQNHKIRARFGDVFTLMLKDPNQLIVDAMISHRGGRKSTRSLKFRKGKVVSSIKPEISSQVAVIVSDIESLVQSMLNYPIEITHYSKDEPFVLGVVEVPWTPLHIDYVKNVAVDSDQPPVLLKETYKTYDEFTSKRVAVITLTIKLSQLKDNFALTTQIRTKYGVDNKSPPVDYIDNNDMGTIKTIYSGGKYTDNSRRKRKNDGKRSKTQKSDVTVDKDNESKKIEDSPDSKIKMECEENNKNKADDCIDAPIPQKFNEIVKKEVVYSYGVKFTQNGSQIVKKETEDTNFRITYNYDKVGKNENDDGIDDKSTHKCEEIIKKETDDKTDARTTQKCFEIVKYEDDLCLSAKITPKGVEPDKCEVDDSNDVKTTHTNYEIVKYKAGNIGEDVASHTVKDLVQSDCINNSNSKKSIASLVRSQTRMCNTSLFPVEPFSLNTRHVSSTSLEIKERLDTLNYIFGNIDGPFGNRVYCVEYFTVENDRHLGTASSSVGTPTTGNTPTATNTPTTSNTPNAAHTPTASNIPTAPHTPSASNTPTAAHTPTAPNSPTTGRPQTTRPKSPDHMEKPQSARKQREEAKNFSINICGDECPFGGPKKPCFDNVCELNLPEKAANLIEVGKCQHVECDFRKKYAPLTDPLPDEIPILVDFGKSQTTKDCCAKEVQEVEVFSGMTANLINDPCSCTCECTFGFIAKTTYCNICGGFEVPGDEMKSTRGGAPFPCPIYHNLTKGKKGLSKKSSATGDESLTGKGDKGKSRADRKSIESDRESAKKRRRKRRRDPRFKFNYGYKGIPPQIGHSQCALPCTGDMNPVPKHMGWLWTANNIPGLKVRPGWRPGAANKHVVRMLRMARFPDEVLNKRRRKDTGKKKRPLKRPLLVVQKKDGEYNITMETMRTFTKPRAVNQYPYEDKPLVQYTIGRTDEENAERQKRKERAQRRLEREQRAFLQSAFHDMCKEICLKTYQQALGMLPFGEDSWCPCFPDEPPADKIDESHSCSCTESTRSSGSMTDDDEWTIEFTPPNAYYNPQRQIKKINNVDSATQYTYLDYRVKMADRFGSPVPRFFIGPDGTQQCSDLGGFWSPDKKWLEINVDGYIAPDGRWAPNTFTGPCGEQIDTEDGKFITSNGVILTVGVDGYIDCNSKWHFYPKPKNVNKDSKFQRNVEAWKKAGGCVVEEEETKKPAKHRKSARPGDHHRVKQSNATFSCFGDTSPHTLSQMGIAGHGHDRRLLLSTLEQLLKQGEKVNAPHRMDIPKAQAKHRKSKKPKHTEPGEMHSRIYSERIKYKHRKPSAKGIAAVNDRGNKTFVQLKDYANPRAKQRIKKLGEEGISLSSFHVPCFSSFINSEVARQQQLEHILQHNARIESAAVQTLP